MATNFSDFFLVSATSATPDVVADQNTQPLMEEVDRAWEMATKRVEDRVMKVLRQCERFEWLADELRDDLAHTHSITAAAVLACPDSRTSDIERALVTLALKATADSGLLLHAYKPPAAPERLGLLHQIVKIEWENRYSAFSESA